MTTSHATLDHARRFIKRYPRLRRLVNAVRQWLVTVAAPIPWMLSNYAGLTWASLLVRSRAAGRIGTVAASGTRRRVVMLVVSDLARDPRVERQARALARAGYEVVVICPVAWQGEPHFDWGPHVQFTLLPYRRSFYVFPFLYDRSMYKAALAAGASVVHCHDLNTSVIGLAAATETGAYCVCDFHEWFSENVHWSAARGRFEPHPRHVRNVYRAAERLVLAHASAVITTSDSIADAIRVSFETRRPLPVVRNIPWPHPRSEARASLREELALDAGTFVVLYQGGVGPSRHLEPLIEAIRYTRDTVLVIRGPGADSARAGYEALARQLGISERIFVRPPVPGDRVVAEAAGADAGIWTLADLCANFRLALPNKVFEYIAAGIPLLVADYPEVRKIVHGFDIGVFFDPDDPRSIASAMDRLRSDRVLYERCRRNLARAAAAFDPLEELNKLVAIYDALPAGEISPNEREASGA